MKQAISTYSLLTDRDLELESSQLEDLIDFLHSGDIFDAEIKIEQTQMMSAFYEQHEVKGEGSIASRLTRSTQGG